MKKFQKLILVILVISGIIPYRLSAQCEVSKKTSANGSIFYDTHKEQIYSNEDLENGVQIITIEMRAMPITNTQQFKYFVDVFVGTIEPKTPIAPRVLLISFTDGTNI